MTENMGTWRRLVNRCDSIFICALALISISRSSHCASGHEHRPVGARHPSPLQAAPSIHSDRCVAAIDMTTSAEVRSSDGNVWTTIRLVTYAVALVVFGQLLYSALHEAYKIRLLAIEEYGRVIHEFDPYFNYRATEYLWANGWTKFRTWFDYKVWYPLGRPVGTTIYPGMQVTSCLIKQYLLPNWSINDICCFVPAWFGVCATLAVAWLTFECVSDSSMETLKQAAAYSSSNSASNPTSEFTSILSNIPLISNIYETMILPLVTSMLNLLIRYTGSDWGLRPRPVNPLTPVACAVCAASLMSIVPAHLLRSVGGGYDNESIAVTAMVMTFACWCKSLKPMTHLWMNALWGVITGFAYFYMVAAWGGYVFVLNVIGVSAGVLVLLGRYSPKLHAAYSCFYVVGTILAIQVPVVGWTPLKSLEQMGPLVAFGGLQLIWLGEHFIEQRGGDRISQLHRWKLRLTVYLSAGAVAAVVVAILWPTGYFGPISSRVRGLFVEHTKTGNPLVDSVAEHQAASLQAYFQYLNHVMYLAPVGMATTALFFVSDSSSFLLVYGLAAYFFSHRMVRLILLTGPIASALGGIVLGRALSWAVGSIAGDCPSFMAILQGPDAAKSSDASVVQSTKNGKPGKKAAGKSSSTTKKNAINFSGNDPLHVKGIRIMLAALAIYRAIPYGNDFWDYAHNMARGISHPSIIQKGTTRDGQEVTIDDYREAYWWLRDNTPEDARIMAWWDYGYQITGISERTTLADGNTWNHEHIALLGRTLTAPEKEAHRIARHLADYVLVWSGGGGDDLAKSPHLRRIANSVFRGLCGEPTCRDFGFYSDRSPTESMEESLLFKLVMNQVMPEVRVDPNRFKEVFRSKHAKVRIYKILSVSKESKEWVANPANRICDAPGSWFCRGQYPPALEKILKEKRDFKQLEDFNRNDGQGDEEYTRQYMENLKKGHGSVDKVAKKKKKQPVPEKPIVLSPEDIDMINEDWTNDETTTIMWELVSKGRVDELRSLLAQIPQAAHSRSEDGRGPMFWAYEYGQTEVIELLKSVGVSVDRTDSQGLKPTDLARK